MQNVKLSICHVMNDENVIEWHCLQRKKKKNISVYFYIFHARKIPNSCNRTQRKYAISRCQLRRSFCCCPCTIVIEKTEKMRAFVIRSLLQSILS